MRHLKNDWETCHKLAGNDFWDSLGGQKLVTIGRWNQKATINQSMFDKNMTRKGRAISLYPFSYSLWNAQASAALRDIKVDR